MERREQIAERLERIARNEQLIYNAGVEKGKAEAEKDGYNQGYADGIEQGKQAEYDAFWDAFQNYGNPKNYAYAFAYDAFTDETYNPKYPIRCLYSVAMSGNYIFTYSKITNTKVPVICGDNHNMTGAFANSKIATIPKFVVLESNKFVNTFQKCTELKNITIEGVIANNISFAESSLLCRESIESIINALSTITNGTTLTLSQTAKENAFTDEEWASLIATKPNWTISLA